jgi:hypothetical protein
MALRTLEVYSVIQANNTLKIVAEHESFTGSVSLNSYLNDRLVNRVSMPYDSIKLIVTAIEATKFNEEIKE